MKRSSQKIQIRRRSVGSSNEGSKSASTPLTANNKRSGRTPSTPVKISNNNYQSSTVHHQPSSSLKQFSKTPPSSLPMTQMFDDSQLAAIESDINTPLIISAGPGSGKTRTLCGRIVYLLQQGAKAHECLTLTFSKRAAQEMEHRIDGMSIDFPGYDTQSIKVSTFHAFCLGVMHQNEDRLKLQHKHFTIATRSQQLSFLKEGIVKWNHELTRGVQLEPDDPLNQELFKKEDATWLLNWIAKQKCRGLLHTDLQNHKNGFFYTYYENQLSVNNLIDFMDMILITIDLFNDNPDIVDKYSNRFKYVLVDEFQDLNPSQFQIVMFLLKNHHNITIVGDDDQSIYGFRGGTAKLFAKFRQTFPNHQEKQLQINYRSTLTIVKASQSLIQYNHNRTKKYISTFNETGEKITIRGVHSIEEEIDYIVHGIKRLVDKGSSYREIAIMSRLHKNALGKYEEEMKKRGIPFIRFRKKGFSDREVIRIVLSYMSLAVNEYDDEAFRKVINIPSRGIGDAAQLYIENYRKELKKKTSLLQALEKAHRAGYPATKTGKKANSTAQASFEKFLTMIKDFSKECRRLSIPDFITNVAKRIGCKNYAEKMKLKEEKARETKRKVQEKRNQRAGVSNDVPDQEDDTEDLDIEYNVEENLLQLITSANQYTNERYDKSQIDLMSTSERIDLLKAFVDVTRSDEDERELLEKQSDPDAITITTIHGAKGLEWQHCFIVRANQGMMPISYRRENDTDEEYDNKDEHYEEERRLFYVALSRAKKTVSISYIVANEKDRPSMYIEQIAKEYVSTEQNESKTSIMRPSFQPQPYPIKAGNKIPTSLSHSNAPANMSNSGNLANANPFTNQKLATATTAIKTPAFKPVSLPPKPISGVQHTLHAPLKTQEPHGLKMDGVRKPNASIISQPSQAKKNFNFKPISKVPPSTSNHIQASEQKRFTPTVPPTLPTQTQQPRANPQSVVTQKHNESISFAQIQPMELATQSPSIKRSREHPSQSMSQTDDFSDGFLFDDLHELFHDETNQPTQKRPRTYM